MLTNKKKIIFILFLLLYGFKLSFSQKKIPLDPSVYDFWKDLENTIISENGKWISFEINPQKGDGWLFLKNNETNKTDSIARGYGAKFSTNSDFLVFKIKAQEDTIRKAKIAKKKDDDLPKDSLGIWLFKNNSIIKAGKLKSFKIAKDNSTLIAYLLEKETLKKDSVSKKDTSAVQDTLKTKVSPKSKEKNTSTSLSTRKEKKKKSETGTLFIFNPAVSKSIQFKDVSDYSIANNGSIICFITLKKDSTSDTSSVYIFDSAMEKEMLIYKKAGTAKKVISDDKGEQISFIFSADTTKSKVYNLFYRDNKQKQVICIADSTNSAISKKWSVSENFDSYFSKDGTKLYFGTAPKPENEKKDTIPDDEKVKLDLWNWKDTVIQPQQLADLEKDMKRSYISVYYIKDNKIIQLASETMPFVTPVLKGNGNIGIGYSYKPYNKSVSWITNQFKDVFLVDFFTGKRKLILQKKQSVANISPNGNFIIWYEMNDSTWNIYSIKTEKSFSITKNIKVNFWDEENDVPAKPDPYGLAGWSKDDKYVFIYDKFDIWQITPDNKEKPQMLTKGTGRKNNITYRYVETDRDALWINPEDNLLLKAFNNTNKQEGFYNVKINSKENPKELLMGEYKFTSVQKSKKADMLIWKKGNFEIYPDLWFSNTSFQNATRISFSNPQQNNYLWGSAELIKWKLYDGKESEGLLYKPANFDNKIKYPVIIYFYEKNSDQLYQHYTPKPSRSVIGFSEYTSNGYVIFIPDIFYTTGNPGQDAYNAIMSGTDYIVSLGFVDKEKMGLQGQSWGGYQTAYLVTRSNRFKAAMAGAAVSNMTSAYGGIRWSSGHSRMMQYEDGQSRIGGTLWDKRDKFIENSPIFFADKIQTPLLLMNNDNDGAVPWYQGIELFLALRRLNKPVWLLNYNGDDHNLKKRANCIDLSIRMSQFFNHYLKDAPAPEWLEQGIPALKKGKEKGYDFITK